MPALGTTPRRTLAACRARLLRQQQNSSSSQVSAAAFQAAKQRPTPSSQASSTEFHAEMQRSSPSSRSQGSVSVLLQAAMQRPCPSSQVQAPALLQAAMQPPSSSSQASASAGRPHVDHRLLDLGPTALCAPHCRLAVVSVCLILNLPTPATESMEGHAPWETLNPLSHEAPGIDFSTAYSVSDEEFLHRSNFAVRTLVDWLVMMALGHGGAGPGRKKSIGAVIEKFRIQIHENRSSELRDQGRFRTHISSMVLRDWYEWLSEGSMLAAAKHPAE
uniref:Uncharacterized protein n=1 Tax=Oryza glumipatula TaxID=40148 RepID=A0A0E0A2J7_9ORYZ